MQAINHYIVIRKIKEAPVKVGGLELTEDANKDVRYLKEWGDKLYHVISLGDVVIVE